MQYQRDLMEDPLNKNGCCCVCFWLNLFLLKIGISFNIMYKSKNYM